MEWLKNLLGFLLSPSVKYSILSLVGGGIIVGIAGVVAFELTMSATNTEEFCTSCHEMGDNPAMMLVGTTHHMNSSGVRPTCSDCHVPKEFIPKMIRKVQASRELWGAITGKINTAEKYAAHTPAMKEREISRLKANDSQECRNCHDVDHMLSAIQTSKARSYHAVLKNGEKTCIDCHAGLTHTPADKMSMAY